MVTLVELPREILISILEALADQDIRSLFTAQRTCQLLRLVVAHIITENMSSHGIAIHHFLQSHFLPIMDSSKASPKSQPTYMEGYSPFYSLPWTSDPETRIKYEREEATWRQIPLVASSGHLVKRMHVILQCCYIWEDHVTGLTAGDVVFYSWEEEGAPHYFYPQGIPLGLYYDCLLGYFSGYLKGGWKLLPGKRVDMEACLQLEDSLGQTTNAEVMKTLIDDHQYAVLVLFGTPNNRKRSKDWTETWRPCYIGDDWNAVTAFCAQRRFTKEQSELWAVKQWE